MAKLRLSVNFPSNGGLVFFELPAGEVTLGRDPGCQVVVDDAGVAARHARLVVGKGGAEVEALDGAEITIDGAPVAGPAPLAVGQKLGLVGSDGQLGLVDLPDEEITRRYPNTVSKADLGQPVLQGTEPAAVLWSVPVASHPFLQLAASRGLVVVGGDRIIAFAADTGAVQWEEEAGSFVNLAIAGDLVIYQQWKRKLNLCRLTACELLTGKKRWQLRVDGAVGELRDAGDGSLLFTSTRGGAGDTIQVSSVDLTTGALRWTTPTKSAEAHLRAVSGGRALLTIRRGLLALDLAQGTEAWRVAVERVHPDDAIAADDGLLFVGTPARLQARRLADGEVQWEAQGPGHPEGRPRLIAGQGRILMVFDEGLVGINATPAATEDPAEAAAAAAGKVGGQVIAWSAASGRLLWHLDVRNSEVNDHPHRRCQALVSSEAGQILALDDRLQTIAPDGAGWRDFPLGGRYDGSLCTADGQAYFLTVPSTLVAARLSGLS
jgi:outer membrane protein assembly factor BamB